MPPLHPRCRCVIIYREVEKPRALQPKPKPRESLDNFDLQRFGGQKLPEGNYNLTVRRQVQNRHIEGTFDLLLAFDKKKSKVKITTVHGDVYFCKLDNFAEDEDDWAYHFISPDYPTKYFILECNFIERIEELSEEEWQQHLDTKEEQ